MLEPAVRPGDVRFDIVSLGEVMLRFDPGAGRIRTSRRFASGKAVVSTTSPGGCAGCSGFVQASSPRLPTTR